MTPEETTTISKTLSYVLRHRPDSVGLVLDPAGWTDVDVLLAALAKSGRPITRETLDAVVTGNDKQRFEFSPDGLRIRARQGHSVSVELGYAPIAPPDLLYHGTATRHLASIRKNGLIRGRRHDVHLSTDREMMLRVGARHGRPVVLTIDARAMHAAGHHFQLTGNNVWLTARVPPEFIQFPADS